MSHIKNSLLEILVNWQKDQVTKILNWCKGKHVSMANNQQEKNQFETVSNLRSMQL